MIINELKTIIFDLDGTLVDSSESVLESLERSLLFFNLKPLRPLNSDIIGPPLCEILKEISGVSDQFVLNLLAEKFKENYDNLGFKKTSVFSGIDEMLNELKDNNLQLYIATNKRSIPTKKIINFLGWGSFFDGIYSLDSFLPLAKSKNDILAKIISTHGLSKKNVIYIGDLEDDRIAAQANNIGFYFVEWGYDGEKVLKYANKVSTPKELSIELLKA